MEALHRVARNYKPFPDRLKKFHIQFYALNKNGEYGAGSLWGKHPNGQASPICGARRHQSAAAADHAAIRQTSAATTNVPARDSHALSRKFRACLRYCTRSDAKTKLDALRFQMRVRLRGARQWCSRADDRWRW